MELVYITNTNGVIEYVEKDSWDSFLKNESLLFPKCDSTQVIGRSIFEYMTDVTVASFFRYLMHLICTKKSQYKYAWFCDSKEKQCKMIMSVRRLIGQRGHRILWMSKIREMTPQDPISCYLEKQACQDIHSIEKESRAVCSFCKRILISAVELNSIDPFLEHSVDTMEQLCPEMEDDIPIIGMQGKKGVQANIDLGPDHYYPPFSQDMPRDYTFKHDADHVWLCPSEFYSLGLKEPNQVHSSICEVCYFELANTFVFRQ